MKLDWITDPHLDHLGNKDTIISFAKNLHKRDSDALIITGDIAESKTIYDFLGILSGAYQRPIYFVLGNHDYYGDFISTTKQKVRKVCKEVPQGILNWATESGIMWITDDTVLIGHDGFYDGLCGLSRGTNLGMVDFQMRRGIYDLASKLILGSRHLFDAILRMAQKSRSKDELENLKDR